MSRNLEPKYDIRFIEKVGEETEIQEITKFPTVVGHGGNIRPLICNGKISKNHCTVTYDIDNGAYQVEDGANGKPSTNHLYFSDCIGGDCAVTSKAILSKPGQAVYLIRLLNGTEAYIELYDPNDIRSIDPRATKSLDPLLRKTNEIAIEARQVSEHNAVRLSELDGRLQTLFAVFDYLGEEPRKAISAIAIITLMIVIGLPTIVIWANRQAIVDIMLKEETYKREQKYKQ